MKPLFRRWPVLAGTVLALGLAFAPRAGAQTPGPTLALPNASATAAMTPTLAIPDASATASTTPSAVVTVVVTATPGTPTPTFTPTATPTATGTPTPRFNPAATPAPGGNVEVLSRGDVHTTDGQSVGAGSFRINNTSGDINIIRQVRIQSSEPVVFAALTLTTSEGSVTVSSPSPDNSFDFNPGVEIPAGESATFTLGADIGEDTSNSSGSPTPETTTTTTPTVTATATPNATLAGLVGGGGFPSSRGGSGGSPFGKMLEAIGVGVVITGLLTALFGIGERRWRRLAGMSLVLLGIALYAGCGGEQTSRQTIAEVTAESSLGPLSLTGLPADLGSVSRPQPLIFPGGTSDSTTSSVTTIN